jgi:Ca2+-binding EF-hand superfamily protein
MPKEFRVQNAEEFEIMIKNRDFRISEALVSTILKNLKGKKRHHHALSIVSLDEDAVYDVTIDRNDFCHTLTESLNRYEEEEKYEECVKIREAIAYLKGKK